MHAGDRDDDLSQRERTFSETVDAVLHSFEALRAEIRANTEALLRLLDRLDGGQQA